MKRSVVLLVLFASIFLSQSVLASVSLSGSSVVPKYNPNSTIVGWLNLSVINEQANSFFSTDSNQNISLINFILAQNFSLNSNYSCYPANCNYSYSTTGSGSSTDQFHLNAGQSEILGVNITGLGVSVSNFSLAVTSDAPESNVSQLSIDLLNDNKIEWSQYNSSGDLGVAKYYGCYLPGSAPSGTVKVNSINFCEEIFLSPSPIVNLGSEITGSGVSNIDLSIYDLNFNELGECNESSYSGEQVINCIAANEGKNVSISGGNYYVCVKTDTPQDNPNDNYYINYQTQSPLCGFWGNSAPKTGGTTNYAIFAQPGNFSTIGSFILNDTGAQNSGYNGPLLGTEISSYISSNYNKNCANGCVIPINFSAAVSQNISLSSLNVMFSTVNGPNAPLGTIYNISLVPPTYSTKGFQNFSLGSASFFIPNVFGPHDFILSFNNNTGSYQLLSDIINISQPTEITSLSPTLTTTRPTNFSVSIANFGSASPVSYQWNFGDGSGTETTSTNNILYSYNQLGNFNLQVTVTNSLNFSSTENFTVDVIAPRDAVNQLLGEAIYNLQNIQNELKNFSTFSQISLNQTLNLQNVSDEITNLKAANNSASSDNVYVTILNQLESLNLPSSIFQTQSALIPFFQTKDNLDLGALESIGGGTYSSNNQNDYINAIIADDLGNVTAMVNYGEFSAAYGQTVSPILDTVEIDVNGPVGYYLVIPSSFSNLAFSDIYQQSGNYYYIPLTGTQQTVQFSTTDSLNITELPIFIAPSLSLISISPQTEVAGGMNKYVTLALVIGGIIFAVLIVVILIARWYRRRYESYLFKDRNDLYNIISYIHSEKVKGINNRDIEKNLRKSRWTSEQISYVMKRYANRRQKQPKK